MHRPFDPKDAKQVLSAHGRILDFMSNSGVAELERARQEVFQIVDAYVKKTAADVLAKISLKNVASPLYRKLYDAGFKNLQTLASAPYTSYSGYFTDVQFEQIRNNLKNIIVATRKRVKVRLSVDDKNPDTDKIVLAVAQYLYLKQAADKSWQFLVKYASVRDSIKKLRRVLIPLGWFFASGKTQQEAASAFAELLGLLKGGVYISDAEKIYRSAKAVVNFDVEKAWSAFEKAPVQFNIALEDIYPREEDEELGANYDFLQEDDSSQSTQTYEPSDSGYSWGDSGSMNRGSAAYWGNSGRSSQGSGSSGSGWGNSGRTSQSSGSSGSGWSNSGRTSQSSGSSGSGWSNSGRTSQSSGSSGSGWGNSGRSSQSSGSSSSGWSNSGRTSQSSGSSGSGWGGGKSQSQTPTPSSEAVDDLFDSSTISIQKYKTVYGLSGTLLQRVRAQEVRLQGMRCDLRRYQRLGVQYALCQKRVLLGDEMGLGKTVQAIATMVSLRNSGKTHFLVVCPLSVLENWLREIYKMSDLRATTVYGREYFKDFWNWQRRGGVAVTTYETLKNLSLDSGSTLSALVVDEAHYVKNPNAQRTQAVRKFAAKAEQCLFMTGTALENRVDEMISIIDILQPQIARLAQNSYLSYEAPQFREIVAPVYYRRKRDDVLQELPDLTIENFWCDLNDRERDVYFDSLAERNFQRVRRVSWNVGDLKRSTKAQCLKEIVDNAKDDRRKVLVFSYFRDTLNSVEQMFGSQCVGQINGSVPMDRRQRLIDNFNNAPAGSVLVAQIQSGGTGLNIQTASVVVICEPQFKPSTENQAISRAYRMGQTRKVLVYRLLVKDTIEERMVQRLYEKETLFNNYADKSRFDEQETADFTEKSFAKMVEDELRRGGRRARA